VIGVGDWIPFRDSTLLDVYPACKNRVPLTSTEFWGDPTQPGTQPAVIPEKLDKIFACDDQ